MFSFLISIAALVAGYLLYGRVIDRIFGPDANRITPAIAKEDGVDFVPMSTWKVYMIQFLNIAGTGPIFGAIMGAKFGPSCYLWIVFGCIFAGAVHDYFTGMLSLRNNGVTFPEIISIMFGRKSRIAMMFMATVLLLLVGTVFVYSPALILGDIAGDGSGNSTMMWVGIIFAYYLIATLLPINKLIGRIYPLFAFVLMFMAVSLCVCLICHWPSIPEFWDGLYNRGPSIGLVGQPIFPCLFITVACGAISGFHATQSPLMARCLKNEKQGRRVFYGSMVTEGVVALIWAAVSSYFFFGGGAAETGSTLSAAAPAVVTKVSWHWLGLFGGILAILGVVAAPITSGDTAFRSARLNLADFFHISQKKRINRIAVSIPIFALAALLLWFNVAHEDGFNIIWRYFGIANQCLATFMLGAATVYLTKRNPHSRQYLVALLPAVAMFSICISFLLFDKTCLGLPQELIPYVAVFAALWAYLQFITWHHYYTKLHDRKIKYEK